MRFHFLGTGTSFGVPEIGCDCATCRSTDPRDQRLRSSLWVQSGEYSIMVDTTPDFRQQCLRARVPSLNAVLITHTHADHIFGMDDVRIYNRLQKGSIPIYLPSQFDADFRRFFNYTLTAAPAGLTRPRLELKLVDTEVLRFGELTVQPVVIMHGDLRIAGYVFASATRRLAYLTDCKSIDPASLKHVIGADVIVLGALWKREWRHPGHLNLDEALALAAELQGGRTLLTHLTHHMGLHAETSVLLPDGVELAWDGMQIELPEPASVDQTSTPTP